MTTQKSSTKIGFFWLLTLESTTPELSNNFLQSVSIYQMTTQKSSTKIGIHTRTFKQFPPICNYLSNDDTKVIHQDRIFLVANTRVYQSRIEIVLLEHLNINAKSDKDCFMFMDLYISIIVSKLEKIVNFHYNNHFTWLRFSCTSDTRFIYQSGICISLLEYRKSLNKKIQK